MSFSETNFTMSAAIFLGKCGIVIAVTGEWHCHLLTNALAPLFHLLPAFQCWSQVTEKFHSSGSLYCGGKMGIYSLVTVFSWKLTASSQTPPCFGAGPCSGIFPGSFFPQTMWIPRDSSGIALMALQSTVRWF